MKWLKDGRPCLVEVPTENDAAELLEFSRQVLAESANLTLGLEKRELTLEEEKSLIRKQCVQEDALMLVARVAGVIVGNLSLHGGVKERLRRSASMEISVLQEYWGLGIGKLLLEEMIRHAKNVGLARVNLKVRSDHERAIALYKKMGFEEQGKERFKVAQHGEVLDLYLMGLVLEDTA